MATNNAVNIGLSGSSGTGVFIGSNSPTITTPNIIGTSTNNNAAAGSVGEYISSTVLSSAPVTFASGSDVNLTSISLTAGDWNVWGNIGWTATAVTTGIAWINNVSATTPDSAFRTFIAPLATSASLAFPVVAQRYSLASTTTIYISGFVVGTGTISGFGFIAARRMR